MNKPLNFGLGRNVYQNITRPSAAQLFGQQPAAGVGVQEPVSPDIMPLRRAVIEQQMRPRLTPAQQFTAMTPPQAPPPRPDRPKRGLLDGMLPGAGTPEAAGLGAAGQRMLELSGYSKMPIPMSQILGEAAKAYTTTRQETAASQAAAERQRQQDAIAARREELELANIRSQIAERDRPDAATDQKPLSPAGKYAYDLGHKPGTPEFQAAIKEYREKMGQTESSLTALQKEARQIFPDSIEKQNEFIQTARQRLAGVPKRDGFVLDENNVRVGRSIFDPATSRFMVVDDATGLRRELKPGERPISDSDRTTLLISQDKHYTRRKDLLSEKLSANKLIDYAQSVGKTTQGAGRLVDQFMAGFNTFIGKKKLSEEQLALLTSQGKLQGLLGAFRIETVGGGVMTEQDALRVIQYLGGDLTALQNKERVKEALSFVLDQKIARYNDEALIYNEQQALRGVRNPDDFIEPLDGLSEEFRRAFEPETQTQTTDGNLPPVPEGVDPEVWAAMTDEERALWP